tara:strand:- start:35968 stop:36381 length:414 start_codon:yes stop_codon:yes gene_type:complete
MARLHAAAFTLDRPWQAAEFASLMDSPLVLRIAVDHGFALTRTVARESELLTIAVDPAHQRQGIARGLMQHWLSTRPQDADSAFLEVAADNAPAIALYAQMGFGRIATRKAYYARASGPAVDALILRRDLTHGQPPQ